MRITESQLRQIIRESVMGIIREFREPTNLRDARAMLDKGQITQNEYDRYCQRFGSGYMFGNGHVSHF